MHVGLDFDNTVAGYDSVFVSAAQSRGFISDPAARTKLEVRSAVRSLEDGERKWMTLQGEVYGKLMKSAELIAGVNDFLAACKSQKIRVHIVSHKTEHGHYDVDRVNLRDAARAWMKDHGFFDADGFGLNDDDVIFESTREDKVAQIASIGCSHFVDDLEEVFLEPGFPQHVEGILFDPAGTINTKTNVIVKNSWQDIQDHLLAT